MKKNPVVHFEMPADDRERVSKFYEKVFGWEMQLMGQDFGEYIVAVTTDSDDKGPLKPGAINGGFYKRDQAQDPTVHVVISVDNLDDSIKNVEEAGGKIVGEKIDIPGIGLYATFKDTEGNSVGLLQPAERDSMKRD